MIDDSQSVFEYSYFGGMSAWARESRTFTRKAQIATYADVSREIQRKAGARKGFL